MRGRVVAVLVAATLSVAGGGLPAGAQSGTGSLSGTVTDASGQPLAGVCVEVYAEDYAVVTTGDDGSYRADGLTPGSYLVGFNGCPEPLPGHAAEFFDNAAGFSDATTVDVQPGADRPGVDAALEEAATIRGTVTDQDTGDPLEDTCVVALELDAGLFALGRTDAEGAYALENLRGGEYLVLFADCGDPFTHIGEFYDDFPVDLPLGGVEPEPATVQVEDGEDVTGIDAALVEGGSLVGTVTARHTGRPVDLVCVGLFASDAEDDMPSDVSGTGFRPDGEPASGQYVFAGVQPGDYAVGFNPEMVCGDDGYDHQWAQGKPDRESADVLAVRKGEVTAGVDAVVSPRPSIGAACFMPPSDGSSRFRDVADDSVHRDAIECVVDRGIASGRADGSYGPAEPVRRDQMATVVAGTLRALGVELPADPPNAFSDDDASVHAKAIDQLAALGVVSGKGAGRYAPADTVSRGQMTAFLVRAYERAAGFPLLEPDDVFSDDDGTTHESTIDRAATAGLTAGSSDRAFRPGSPVQRDQLATFAARLLDRVARDTGQVGFLSMSGSASVGASPVPVVAADRSAGAAASPGLRRLAEVAAAMRAARR